MDGSQAMGKAAMDGLWNVPGHLAACEVSAARSIDRLELLSLSAAQIAAGGATGIELPGLKRWMALARLDLYWVRPHYGTSVAEIPRETQLLLWEAADGRFGMLLPLVDAGCRTSVYSACVRHCRWDEEGNPRPVKLREHHGISLVVEGVPAGAEPAGMRAALIGCATHPYRLRDAMLQTARDLLGTFRLRAEKPEPPQRHSIGWCSWDAFRRNISAEKITASVRALAQRGVHPGWVIIDDGWQDARNGHLLYETNSTHRSRFPEGIAATVRALHDQGVGCVGLWHTLQGYWQGIDPDGPLGARHRLLATTALIPASKREPQELHLVDPGEAEALYMNWYGWLHEQGVSFTKVDNQSGLELYTQGRCKEAQAMALYQQALQTANAAHLDQQGLHCMSHGSDVLFHLRQGNWIRNSQDYWKDGPPENHQRFVAKNAVNAFLLGAFAWPDWDMFLSDGPFPLFHALARAISGGPVYCSDGPEAVDASVLSKIALPDGSVPAFDRPAQLPPSLLLCDLQRDGYPTVLTNRCGPLGVLGVFHCAHGVPQPLTAHLRASDIHDLTHHGPCVVADPMTLTAAPCGMADVFQITLQPLGCALRVLSPLINGIALLGAPDLLNGAATVRDIQASAGGLSFAAQGPCRQWFWSHASRPVVRVDGVQVECQPAGSPGGWAFDTVCRSSRVEIGNR